ncbi:MAG: primosomal protein N' [Ignavibacteria bacterium]|nr:primosomal protein N' [Ignavibacteria bacterium]
MKPEYVNIAFDLPVRKLFTYKVPSYLLEKVDLGMRAIVPFGKKILTGIIFEYTEFKDFKVKEIKSLLDEERIIENEYLNFCKWLSEYYVAPIGELLFSGIPRKTNLTSDFYYSLAENYIDAFDKIKSKEDVLVWIYDLFKNDTSLYLTKKQIEKKLNISNSKKYLDLLVDAGVIECEKSYTKPTKPKFAKLIIRNFNPSELDIIIQKEKIKSNKQKLVLEEISKTESKLLQELIKDFGISISSINTLLKKDLIKVSEIRIDRQSGDIYTEPYKEIVLNKAQSYCLDLITAAIKKNEFKTFLLHGVTGSGKTEVYIRAIRELLKCDKQAIVLVPEISLTPQLIHRFRVNFGNIIGVIHSRLSDGERLDTFDRIRSMKYKIIIGARSALFAPVKKLGFIVVDEEHDTSYKQETSPRYNARDAAIIRAKINSIPVVLGSATPSLESYYNAITGKYSLLNLPERATKINMPKIIIVDTRHKTPIDFNTLNRESLLDLIEKVRVKFLSRELLLAIDDRLKKGENIILLQNRRGYHSYLECLDCGNVEMCRKCSIALTFHKVVNLLKCHYCGFSKSRIENCSVCGSKRIIEKGTGTERIEEEITKLFPSTRISRLDSDAITSRKKYESILSDFSVGNIDILVGTQIIAKGLDFPNVTLVGVINADIGLLHPDFRATERTFQILTQVAGRSGRSEKIGEVIIQTSHPEYKVFEFVKNHDFESYYNHEILTRKAAGYPPFYRIVLIEVNSKDKLQAESKIKELFNFLVNLDKRKLLEILHPVQPLFSKLRERYRFHIILKSKKSIDPSGKYLTDILNFLPDYIDKHIPSSVRVIIDVDPLNLL